MADPAPTGWVVFRGELRTPIVGPFPTEQEAVAWQEADDVTNGDGHEWTTWPLFSPESVSG